MEDLSLPKMTHSDFVDEFRRKIQSLRFEFETRGLDVDLEDLGEFADRVMSYGNAHSDDEFLRAFWRENGHMIGDVMGGSPFVLAKRPFQLALSYRGKAVSVLNVGPECYGHDVYAPFRQFAVGSADQFLLPAKVGLDYLSGDKDARTYLLGYLNFQKHRNWHIIWAKMDWIRLAFPKVYERMMNDGEFLSVEELDMRRKEAQS